MQNHSIFHPRQAMITKMRVCHVGMDVVQACHTHNWEMSTISLEGNWQQVTKFKLQIPIDLMILPLGVHLLLTLLYPGTKSYLQGYSLQHY